MKLAPDDSSVRHHYGKLFAIFALFSSSRSLQNICLSVFDPNYFLITYFPLNFAAEFLSAMSRNEEACEQRIKAAELSPNDYSLAVAAATALRLLDRKNEAEKWYRTVRNIAIHFSLSL